jgi:hypothetical protein
VKRILWYLKETKHLLLGLEMLERYQSLRISIYTDADFAGEVDTTKSTSEITILDCFGALVQWESKRQTTVVKFATDAEFTATAMTIEEGL